MSAHHRTRSRWMLLLGVAFVFLLGPQFAAAQTTEVITAASSSPWTAPTNVYSVTVECWGGGGAGAGDGNNDNQGVGGGGGGAYAKSQVNVTPGNNYTFAIGAAGTGASNSNGAAGGTTSFNTNSCIAPGGQGGTFTPSLSGGAGGTGATGNVSTSNGSNGQVIVSSTSGGNGGRGGNNSDPLVGAAGTGGADGVNGGNAGNYASGGGGSGDRAGGPQTGGSGSAGVIRLTYSTTIDLGGTVYTDAGNSTTSDIFTVKLAVGTSTPPTIYSTTTDANGNYTFTFDAGTAAITSETPLLFWVDNSPTTTASTFIRPSGLAPITDVDLWGNHAIIRTESATNTSIADLAFYDNANDSDIPYTATTTGTDSMTVLGTSTTLYVWGGDTFEPNGNVTVQGSLLGGLNSTYTGSTTAFSLTFTGTSSGLTVGPLSGNAGDVVFNGSGGEWDLYRFSVQDFTITNGTVTLQSGTLSVGDDFIQNGLFTNPGGQISVGGQAYRIHNALSSSIALSVAGEEISPRTMLFNDDGTILYVMGFDGDDINAYPLPTPYDIASYTSGTSIALSVAGQEIGPVSMLFNNTGTILYVMGSIGDDINAYPLPTPYDIASYTSGTSIALDVSGQETVPNAMLFNADGTILYVLGSTDDDINAYPLPTPYDIASYTSGTSIALSVAGQETSPYAMLFNDDGTILYVMGAAGQDINAYPLPTPYDIASYTSGTSIALSVAGQVINPVTMLFNNTGTILYVLGIAGQDINAYPISVDSSSQGNTISGTLTGDSHLGNITVRGASSTFANNASTSDLTVTGGLVAPSQLTIDGKLNQYGTFTAGIGTVYLVKQGEGYNIFDAGFEDIALSVAGEETVPYDMLFNDDGTILYVLGQDGDDINAYPLPTPYDISSYTNGTSIALDVSGQEASSTAMLFNNDGTILYVLGIAGQDINAYPLPTPYDIASYTSGTSIALSVAGQETEPRSMLFNNTGTILYVMGTIGADINAYPLPTPYDVSSYTSGTSIALDVSGQDTYPTAMLFNQSGTILYVLASVSDNINAYPLPTPYDISSYTSGTGIALDVSSEDSYPTAMLFNNDGTVLYLLGRTGDEINAYSLSAALHTGTFTSSSSLHNLIVASGTQKFTSDLDLSGDLTVNASGTLEIMGSGVTALTTLTMTGTDKTISGAGTTTVENFTNTGSTTLAMDMTIQGDLAQNGTFVNPSNEITIQDQDTPYDISSYTSGTSIALSVAGEELNPTAMLFNQSGTILYVIGGSGDDINAYPLNTAYDIGSGTSSPSSIALDVSGQETVPTAMLFNDDGTILYVMGTFGVDINAYPLPTPYDIASYTSGTSIVLDVSGEESSPLAMLFNQSGTILYVMGNDGDDINAYPLPTPYDISSYTSGTSIVLSVAGEETNPRAMLFNQSGTILYVMGTIGADINAYPLPTPYDISSYTSGTSIALSVAGQELTPTAMLFNDDGTILYVMGPNGDDINAYPLSSSHTVSGTLTGTSNIGNITFDVVAATFASSTSVANLTVTRGAVTLAASTTITDNYTNLGTVIFNDAGTTTFAGTALQTATGTMTGTSELNNVVITNTSGTNATTTPSVVFSTSASSTGSLTITTPGVMVQFANGATTTWQNLNIAGSVSDNVYLYSDESGTEWYLNVIGTSTIEYAQVKDANAASNISGTIYASSSVDAGNNTNWSFTAGEGGGGGGGGAAGGITITGTLYQNDGITPIGAGKLIMAAVGTSTVSLHSTTTDASSNYSISGIATSTVGAWATSTSGNFDTNFRDVEYANGMFVAVSVNFSPRFVYSYDGVNWFDGSGTSANSLGLAYGNGVFVAVNNNATERVRVSTDGINWTNVSAVGNDDLWRDVQYANGRFVAVADCSTSGDCVMYSDDGYNWTAVSGVAGDNDNWYDLVYGDGRWVATGDGTDEVMYSTDNGESWTTGTINARNWRSLTYGNGVFMAFPESTTSGNFATSTDGATWSYGTAPLDAGRGLAKNLLSANGKIYGLAGCSAGTVNDCLMYTEDGGSTWATTTMSATSTYNTMAYGQGKLVVLSNRSTFVAYADAGFNEDTPITLFVDENATTSSSTATTLTYGLNNTAGTSTIYADLIADTVLLQKNSIGGSGNKIRFDDRGFYDSYDEQLTDPDSNDILFTATTSTTTVNADLRIASGTTVYAPQHLVVDGDFQNYGTFYAERGEVVADATWGDVFDARYESVALDVSEEETAPFAMLFNDDGTILYVMGTTGDDINAYPLPTPYDIASYTSGTSIALSVLTEENGPTAMLFNADGTILYVMGVTGQDINAYPLNTAYDIGSGTSSPSSIALSVSGQETAPTAMLFNADGTILYVLGSTGQDINAYPLNTAYDIGSGTSSPSSIALSVSGQETFPRDMLFNQSGTILYVLGSTGDDINAYPLPTPYDIASYISGTSIALSVAGQETVPTAMLWGDDGTILYVLGATGDDINVYTLDDEQYFTGNFSATSSLWDLTIGDTATVSPAATTEVDNDYHVGGSAAGPYAGLVELTGTSTLSGTGNFGFVEVQGTASSTESSMTFTDLTVAATGDLTASTTLTITGDYDNFGTTTIPRENTTYLGGQGTYSLELTYEHATSGLPSAGNLNGLAMSRDGTKMYTLNYNANINEYTLDVPFDVSSSRFETATSLSGTPAGKRGLGLSPDGTRLFVAGNTVDEVFQFTLDTPWSISSARFVASTSVSQTGDPRNITFTPDGLEMIVSSGEAYRYTLNQPYSVVGATYIGFANNRGDTGTAFSGDGRFFFSGGSGNIAMYALATPGDISGGSEIGTFDTSSVTTQTGFTVAANGQKMYVAGNGTDQVYQYDVTARIGTSTDFYNERFQNVEVAEGGRVEFGELQVRDLTIGQNATATTNNGTPEIDGDLTNYGVFNNGGGGIYANSEAFDAMDAVYYYNVDAGCCQKESINVVDNGMRMYTWNTSGSELEQYALTVPYDLSTLSYVTASSVGLSSVQETAVSPDGTKAFFQQNGRILFEYTMTAPWDVTTLTFSASTSMGGGGSARSFDISPDGLKLFTTDLSDDVGEYTFGTPWNLSTLSFVDNTPFGAELKGVAVGIRFSNSGKEMYILDDNAGSQWLIHKYTLSTSFDASTLSYTGESLDVTQYLDSDLFRAMDFGENGYELYLTGGELVQLNLDDIQYFTGNFTSETNSNINNFTIGETATVSAAHAMDITGDLYTYGSLNGPHSGLITLAGTGNITGEGNNGFIEITGSYTAISTTTTFTDLTVASGGTFNAGSSTVVTGDFDASAGTFNANSGTTTMKGEGTYNLELTYEHATSVAAQENQPNAVQFSPDGIKMYVIGWQGYDVNEYILSVPWDVSTARFVDATPLGSTITRPNGLYLRPDGSGLYVIGELTDIVLQYSLSTPFDASTMVQVGTSTNISAQEGFPHGITFSPDGSTMIMVGASADALIEYELTTPWDINSISYVDSTSINTEVGDPVGIAISSDGKLVFVVNEVDDDVYVYALSTPYDASTRSYLGVIDTSPQETLARDVTLSSDGTKLYVIGPDGDDIDQYDIAATLATTTGTNAFANLVFDSGPVTFTGAASTTGTFTITSLATTTFNASSTYTFQNINWQGASSTDLVRLGSSATGTVWYLDVDGTQDVDYVFVQDSDATLSASTIAAIGSTDGGNNTNWSFGAAPPAATSTGITITGTLYQNDGITPIGPGKLIVAAVGTSTVSLHSTTTDASSNYSITGIATSSPDFGNFSTSSRGTNSRAKETVYGNGMFVQIGAFGTGNILRSYDGVTWIDDDAPLADSSFDGIAYGNGMFVVVSWASPVGYSYDGINWATSSAAGDNDNWSDVTYGNGVFVAVAEQGTGDRIMYSYDGINWDTASPAADISLRGVTYGNGTFVAVTDGNAGNQVMTSPNGIDWTLRSTAGANGSYTRAVYGNGTFVAVAYDGTYRFMYSTDNGVTWTGADVAGNNDLVTDVTYGNGIFLAGGAGEFSDDHLFYSSDGINWATTTFANSDTGDWSALAYGNGIFSGGSETSGGIAFTLDAGFGEDTPITLFVDENATTSSSTASTLTYGLNADAGTTTITADLIADTVLLQKTSVNGSGNEIHFDDRAFYDSYDEQLTDADSNDILFTATTSTTTVNADLRIASGTTVFAPQHLVIDGDFDNYGTFYAERGEVVADSTAWDTSEARLLSSFNPGFGNISSVTFGQNGTKMYILQSNETIHQYALSVPYDSTTATLETSTSTSAQDTVNRGPHFSPDGLRFYTSGNDNDAIYQYSLSSAWNVNTASFVNSTSTTSYNGTLGMGISTDGSNIIILDSDTDDKLRQYTLSTPWDITTAVNAGEGDLPNATYQGLYVSPDGTTVLAQDRWGGDLYRYTLSTPWDVTSINASPDSILENPIPNEGESVSFYGFGASDDGANVYLSGETNDLVYQLALDDEQHFTGNFSATSSLWDLTVGDTATVSPAATTEVDNDYHVGGSAAGPYAGLVELTGTSTLSGTGNFGFVEVQGSASSTEVEATFTDLTIASGADFTAPTYGTLTISGDFDSSAGSFDVATATTYFGGQGTYGSELTLDGTSDIAATVSLPYGTAFSTDGSVMYVVNISGSDAIYQFTLGTPWDVTTASYTGLSSTTGAYETAPAGLDISPDGKNVYFTGTNSDGIYHYRLTTPWDISSAQFVYSTTTGTDFATDVSFSTDGRNMYHTNRGTGYDIRQFVLSTPWDLSSASIENSDISNRQSAAYEGVSVSSDGNTVVLLSDSNDRIEFYTLATPWDIGSATHVSNISISTIEARGVDIDWAANGNTLYFSGVTTNDVVYQFDVSALIGTSTAGNALADVFFTASGTSVFTGPASTTGVTIEANATVTAPTLLTTGDFSNSGNFDSNNGVIYSTGVGTFEARRPQLRASTSFSGLGTLGGVYVSPAEEHFYLVSYTADTIYWYEMTTSGDVSTASSSGSFPLTDVDSVTFSNDGTRMYAGFTTLPHIAQYTLSIPWDITTASLVASTTLSNVVDTEESMLIKYDGTEFYVVDQNDLLAQYTLGTPWDITTIVASTTYALGDTPHVMFNRSGNKLNTINGGGLREYTLGTSWDIDTLVQQNFIFYDVFVQGVEETFEGYVFNGIQDTAYAITGSRTLWQYDIPATFSGALVGNDTLADLRTLDGYTALSDVASTTNITVAVNSELETPLTSLSVDGSLAVNGKIETVTEQGTIYLTGTSQTVSGNLVGSSTLSNIVVEGSYTLSSAASTTGVTILSGASLIAPSGILSIAGTYTNNGTFTSNSGTIVIETPEPSVENHAYVGSFGFLSYDDEVTGVAISADGGTLYVAGGTTDALYWSTLATPFDVTSAGAPASTTLTTWITDLEDIQFSPDGTKLFVLDIFEDVVARFDLGTAWDVTSMSFVATTSFSGITTGFLNYDGSKFYYTQFNSSTIIENNLLTPWDLSSASLVTEYDARTDIGIMQAILITQDGRKIFLQERDGGVAEVGLEIPFDVSSVDRTAREVNFTQIGRSNAFSLSSDQKYLYVADYNDDQIDQFQMISDPVATGTMTGTSAFNNLTQKTNLPLTFGAGASTTGTFTIEPSGTATSGATTTVFQAGSTYTFQNIDWAGASSTNEVVLRSSASGTQWYLDVPGSQLNVEFVNVQDSNAAGSSAEIVAATSTDSGNNINWCFTGCGVAPADEWNSTDWTLYDVITIDHTKVFDNLYDFPVYVDLADLSPQFWATIVDGGGDIRVTTNGREIVELPREVVFASTTLETGELHFKADYLNPGKDTSFRIYYNGVDVDYAVTATYGAQNVWTNNFAGVWHLDDDPSGGSPQTTDSTAEANNGIANGTMTTDDVVAGKIGSGYDFDGTNDYVNVEPSVLRTTGNTVSGWIYIDTIGRGILESTSDNNIENPTPYYLIQTNSGNLRSYQLAVAYDIFDPVSTGRWYHFATVRTATTEIGYLDGVETINRAITNTGDNVEFHMGVGFGGYFDGQIDFVKVSSSTRSTGWIKTEYYNQSTTTDFYRLTSGTGSTTLSNHDIGQVDNAFNFQTKTNEPLFAFKLSPVTGNATITQMVFGLGGAKKIDTTNFTNLRLYRDIDADGAYDATEPQVGGSGTMVLDSGFDNQQGSITFTEDFISTTTLNYLLIADWNNPENGAFLNVSLAAGDIFATDSNGAHALIGSVDTIQHSRNNRGGGSSGSDTGQVGGPPPAGDGEQSGGGPGGGSGAVDTNSGGDTIGNELDFNWPTANSGSWSTAANAYDDTDGTYATETTDSEQHAFTAYTHGVPGSDSIEGIEVKLEISGTTAAGSIDVELSWNNGANWTTAKTTPTLTTSDTVVVLGAPGDKWGRNWTASEFSNANFSLRVTGNVSENEIRIDGLQVKVYHQATGGGGGGGGGGGAI